MALSDLLPASFRGVPFAVLQQNSQTGRRLVVHQYPGRDTPWTEDLGRSARRYRFTGFLLQDDLVYGGGDIDAQRALLIAVAEQAGVGILTHPTLGVLQVNCETLSVSDDISADNYCAIEFSFVEFGQQLFPSLLLDTGSAVTSAAITATAAVAADFASSISLASQGGEGGQQALSGPAVQWTTQVQASGGDATAILGLTSQLSGPYGRYSAGANAGFSSGTLYVNSTTVAQLSEAAAASRSAIAMAAAAFLLSVGSLNATSTGTDVAAAAQALVDALNAACANPADAVRLLLGVQSYAPAATTPAADAIGDLLRRAAVTTLSQASASYQPASYDDASNILAQVTGALDDEIETAGDEADDSTFNVLRALRQAVVADLTARGAKLARMNLFAFPASLPDVVLAQRIYRDPTRADQLTTQVDEINPLFMPTTFRALAQ